MSPKARLRRVRLLGAFAPEARERLLSLGTHRTLRRGEAVWEHGEDSRSFTFVVRGRVKLVVPRGNGETIIDVCRGGALLCAYAACSLQPYCCRAVTQEDGTQIVSIPRAPLLAAVREHPDVALALVDEVASRTKDLSHRVATLGQGPVARRVATLLVGLVERTGVARGDGSMWIPIPLTRQDIADLCGTTLESASRVMSRFARAGLVETLSHGFIVADRAHLERAAGLAAPAAP